MGDDMTREEEYVGQEEYVASVCVIFSEVVIY